MKIGFKNLGPLHECTVELGDLTIVTGHNNTGKTYITYGVFGILAGWRYWMRLSSLQSLANELVANGRATLDMEQFAGAAFRQHLTRLAHIYEQNIANVLAAAKERFSNTKVHLDVGDCPRLEELQIDLQQTLTSGDRVAITKGAGGMVANITRQPSAAGNGTSSIPPAIILERWLSDTFTDLIFQPCFPRVYIASTERTGAAIFQRELNLGRNRIIEMLADLKPGENVNPITLMERMASSYAFPVQQNIDFLNPANLEPLQRQQGAIASAQPQILRALEEISGGTYKVTKEGAYFSPRGSRGLKLRLGESSSAVRSLLDVTYYVKHVLRVGDCFMIDEPELNLHPRNQRLFARVVARLVNAGVKVFLTTHSDYIIRELNTMILLSGQSAESRAAADLHYDKDELLDAKRVRFYRTAEDLVSVDGAPRRRRVPLLKEMQVTPQRGIEVESFDEEIDDLNRIQDIILYSSKESQALEHD
jgi:hypothetical protein